MRSLVGLGVAIVVGIGLFEVTMQPSGSERGQLLAVFAGVAALTALAGSWLPRWAARVGTLRKTLLALAVASVLLVGAAVAAASSLMFLSSHDLNLLLVVLGFGTGLGLVFGWTVSHPMVRDLGLIRLTADSVARGDLDARTGVVRPDEVGAAASAIDQMATGLQAAREQRERDEAARRSFLAAVGHDLRTPLSALQAAVEALQDGVAPDPDRYFRSMEKDLSVLSGLVDDLFLLSRIEAGELTFERESIDLAELADEALEALEPVASKRNVRLRLQTDGAVAAMGASDALGRVIRNLIDNAIRYAPDSSEVLVQVSNGSGAVLEVRDRGPGFADEMVDEAFESFVRADPARGRETGGAGLGLAIAKGLVNAHGGEIWAAPGPGGRVGFRLPADS